ISAEHIPRRDCRSVKGSTSIRIEMVQHCSKLEIAQKFEILTASKGLRIRLPDGRREFEIGGAASAQTRKALSPTLVGLDPSRRRTWSETATMATPGSSTAIFGF